MARLSPIMRFFRDVQRLAPDLPFAERARLARFASRRRREGVSDPEAVVREFLHRPNPPAREWEKLLAILVALGLAAVLLPHLTGSAGQVAAPSGPSAGTGCPCGR
jgi:hypothetical protein